MATRVATITIQSPRAAIFLPISSVVCSWDTAQDTFILIVPPLVIMSLKDAFNSFRNRKTKRIPSTNVQIVDSQQNETDTDREMRPAPGSRNAGKFKQATTSRSSTTPVPLQGSNGLVRQYPTAPPRHPLSASISSPTPPLAHDVLTEGSYRDIVSAVTRYVLLGFVPWTSPERVAARR
jgi:hypothetical protein